MKSFLIKNSIFLIIFIAFLLRLPHLSASFWLDEAAQALESTRPLSQQLQIAYDFQPPLFHLFVHFVSYFGTNEALLRSTSLLSGLVIVWATYQLGKRLHSAQLGSIAALLVATNSYHIFYSQELRPYAFAAMWGVLSWLVLFDWLFKTKPNNKNPKESLLKNIDIKYIVLFALITLAGLYSVYLYPFLFFSQIFFILTFHRKYLTSFLISSTVAVFGFMPWLPSFLNQLKVGQQLRINTQGWDQVVSFTQMKALPLTIGKFLYGVVDLDLNLFFGISSLGLLLAICYLMLKLKSTTTKFNQVIYTYFFLFLVPLLTAWIVSFLVPVIQPKRVLFLLPFLYLGITHIGLLALSTKQHTFKHITYLLFTILFLINISGTLQYYTNPKYQRENWKAAIEQIDTSFSSVNTTIIFGFDAPFAPWQWYSHQNFQTYSTGTATVQNVGQIAPILEPALQYDNVIVFDYLRDLTDPNRTIEQWLSAYDYELGEIFDYPNIGFIRVFNKSKHFANNQP